MLYFNAISNCSLRVKERYNTEVYRLAKVFIDACWFHVYALVKDGYWKPRYKT